MIFVLEMDTYYIIPFYGGNAKLNRRICERCILGALLVAHYVYVVFDKYSYSCFCGIM